MLLLFYYHSLVTWQVQFGAVLLLSSLGDSASHPFYTHVPMVFDRSPESSTSVTITNVQRELGAKSWPWSQKTQTPDIHLRLSSICPAGAELLSHPDWTL